MTRTADVCDLPACVEEGHILEVFCGRHHSDQQQSLDRPRGQRYPWMDDFEPLQVHHGDYEAAGAGPAVLCDALEVV